MTAKPLVVRLRNWIGDVVLGLPALELLAAHGHALQLVARGAWAPALLAGYDWPVHVQPQGLPDKLRQLRMLRRQCRAQDAGFDRRDNALLLPESFSSAFEMRLAGLNAMGIAREGRSPLLARTVPAADGGHEAARCLALACEWLRIAPVPLPAAIGMRVTAAATAAAAELRRRLGIDRPYAMICPFAAGRSATTTPQPKKWPAFPEFADCMTTEFGLPVLVCPGPSEQAEAGASYPNAYIVADGGVGLHAALLKTATIVIANDTGPGHLAAAVGAPLVSVLGAAYPERWAPYGPQVVVVQRGVRDQPVTWPTVDEVLKLVRDRLTAGAHAPLNLP